MLEVPPFELLEVLVAVAESKNLTMAASKLKISQPAVSLKLQELEHYVPSPIFGTEGRRKVLTHYGQSLYREANHYISQFETSFHNINRNYATAEHLTLKVATRKELLDHLIHFFKFPGLVEISYASSQESIQMLLSRNCDIAISYLKPDSLHIMAKKIFESNCNFVIHRSFLGKRKLSLDLIRDREFVTTAPCILYQKEGLLLNSWLNQLNLNIADLKVSSIAPGWGTIQSLVNEKFGYAVVPDYLHFSEESIATIAIPPEIIPTFQFYASFHRELKKIKAFAKILEFNSNSGDPNK